GLDISVRSSPPPRPGRSNVGHIALQSAQAPRAGQGLLIQAQLPAAVADEPGLAGRLVAIDDGPGLVLLQGQGAPVPGGSFGRVGPDRPPVPRVGVRGPDWLVPP